MVRRNQKQEEGDYLLRRRILDEFDAFLDVAFEASDCGLDELLLVGVGAAEDVDGLLCSGGLKRLLADRKLRVR